MLFRISAHLPKVRGILAFLSHLPKVRNRTGPSVAPVPAFSFPAASSHLPKAGQIRQYPYHLWKVSTSIFTATTGKCGNQCRCGRCPERQCRPGSPCKDAAEKKFHNGRESREMLPLWKGTGEAMPSRKPIARMRRKSHSATAENRGKCCRCGRRTEGMREGEENSAETLDHCHLGAKRLSPPKGKVWKGVKKGRLCRPSPSFRRKAPALIAPGPFCGKRGF